MTEGPYHYTECGLDYIWLLNGFRRHQTPYGEGVSITEADQLHEVIARAVVTSKRLLRGQEVRFLRSLLQMSQEGLGDLLGMSRASVARWEGAPDDAIPDTADRALRLYYMLKVKDYESAVALIEYMTEIGKLDAHLTFEESEDGRWMEKAA